MNLDGNWMEDTTNGYTIGIAQVMGVELECFWIGDADLDGYRRMHSLAI